MADNKTPVVLVADDEPSMLALVAGFVRSKGYTVVEASDGDMAWQMATSRLPDLIILDVMMPGMSGWEVCRKIREAVSLAHTGVIMLTGIGESLNEMTSPLYGADAYVDKPFELADLERTIVETLKKRREGAMGRSDLSTDGDERQTIRSPAFDGLLGAKRAAAKPAAAKAAAAKPAAAKPTAKKTVAKKPAKVAAKPSVAKKAPAKKAPAKKAPAKKGAAKAAVAKKPAVKKAPAKKAKVAAKPAKKAVKAKAKPVAKKPGKAAGKKKR